MATIDVANADLLLTTTKQVRKRLDLSRPVPRDLLLECIDIASHAPMGGNQERNRWMIIDDAAIKAQIAPLYQSVGRPYLAAGRSNAEGRMARVVDSGSFLVENVAEVPAWVLAMRLDRLPEGAPNSEVAAYFGSVAPGVWSFQLAARTRGLGSAVDDVPLGRINSSACTHRSAMAKLEGLSPSAATSPAKLALERHRPLEPPGMPWIMCSFDPQIAAVRDSVSPGAAVASGYLPRLGPSYNTAARRPVDLR
jgi:nitroreductase